MPNIINFYDFFCFGAGLLHRDCLPDCDDADVRNPMKFDCPLQWACEGNSGCCSNEEIPAALVHFIVPRLLWSCSLLVYMSLKTAGFLCHSWSLHRSMNYISRVGVSEK